MIVVKSNNAFVEALKAWDTEEGSYLNWEMTTVLFKPHSTVPSLGATLPCVPITVIFSKNKMPIKWSWWFAWNQAELLIHQAKAHAAEIESLYLNPIMGHSLQMLHLAWCLAVSAAATLCRTGSHTMDCGSSLIQSRKRAASISGLLLACNTRGKMTRAEHSWYAYSSAN